MLPVWSPDGSNIAFISDREDGQNRIYTMSSEGTNITPITDVINTGQGFPSWSPDGKKIVYEALETESSYKFDIYSIKANGIGAAINLTKTPSMQEIYPFWSPVE